MPGVWISNPARSVRATRGAPAAARTRAGRWLATLGVAIAMGLQTSCVLLPVRVAPGLAGHVVDAETGAPIADALVVVRFEGHYDEVLPDREVLGHAETRTDSSGRFTMGSLVRPGISAWPQYDTDARVVSVLVDGYRCASPQPAARNGETRVALQPALDTDDRLNSCRPVPARRGEATEYMTAWRALFPATVSARDRESERDLDRLLAARAVFGFGENCEGPALDLSMAPDGRRAAFVVEAEDSVEVQMLELRGVRSPKPIPVTRETQTPPRRLAWSGPADLVLWEPAPEWQRSVSPSTFAARFERVWSSSGPAAAADLSETSDSVVLEADAPITLDPDDLDDESDARWAGRSFVLRRSPDPQSGFGIDELSVYGESGAVRLIELPGDPCGEPGRFGRPHYRIAADGRTSLDLRFVDNGCHVVRTDLETGEWSVLDVSERPGVCQSVRRVPGSHFTTALRGYARELAEAVSDSDADPAAAYALHIGEDGETALETRSFAGEPVTVQVSKFPLATPLRRIEVSILGGVPGARGRSAVPGLEPL